MNKKKVVLKIAENAKITVQQATVVLEFFLVTITNSLRRGAIVNINGFGMFTVLKRRSFTIIDPKTGEKRKIAEKKL